MAGSTLPALDIHNDIFRAISSDIEKNAQSDIPQPIVIIGVDGSGKTTLMRQLYDAVDKSAQSAVWIDGRSIFSVKDILDHADTNSNAVVFIDDIDFFFTRCPYEEQYELRGALYNEGAPKLIASAEKILPAFSEYEAPFFEGLKFIYIPPVAIDGPVASLFPKPEEKERAGSLMALLPPTIKSVEIVRNIIHNNDNPDNDMSILVAEYSAQYKQLYWSLPTYSQHILSVIGNTPAPGLLLSEIRETTKLPTSVLSIYLRNLCSAGILFVDRRVKKGYKYITRDPLFGEWLSFNPIKQWP